MTKPRAAKTAAPARQRVQFSVVEITIVGNTSSMLPEVLRHAVDLASQGKSATIKAAGIRATVKVTR